LHRGTIAGCVLLLASSATIINAQKLQFRQLTPDDGLSGSWVPSMFQDSRGFMWFGTSKGVNRYDGYDLVVYRHHDGDSTSIGDNRANAIHEDSTGKLWFGTASGLSRFDPATEKFSNRTIGGAAPVGVDAIVAAGGDSLWLGTTRGLYRYSISSGKSVPYSSNPASPVMTVEIHAIHRDAAGRLLLGTGTKGVEQLDPRTGLVRTWSYSSTTERSLPNNDVRAFVDDATGAVWVATYGGGLGRLDLNTGTITRLQHRDDDPRTLAHNTILAMISDRRQGMWIGTENGGLDHFDPASGRFQHYRVDVNNPSSLSSNSVWSLYQDGAGTLWVGTFSGGVNISKRNGDAIRRYHTVAGDPSSLSGNSVFSFTEDREGAVWVATDGGGVNRLERETGHFTHYTSHTSNLPSDAALAVVTDHEGRVWVGAWGGGVSRFDRERGSFTSFTTKNSNLPDDNVFSLLVDHLGTLWVGTWSKGLQRFDPVRRSFERVSIAHPNAPDALIRHMAEASDGSLLLATDGAGLIIVDPRTLEKRWYGTAKGDAGALHSAQANAVIESAPGIIWIGTGDGLDRLDRRNGVITHYDERDGLPSTFVAGLAVDRAGNLWVSTDRGMTRFDPTMKRAKTYTVADGLQGSEFNMGSSYRARDGSLFFGGNKGFNILQPDAISENPHAPPVALTGFQLFNRPVAIGGPGSPLRSSIGTTRQLTLAHDQSVFTLEFAGLDYAAPEKNEYAYKLEGLDRGWNIVGRQHTASYTNLAPGKYVFRVRAANNDGVWNQAGTSLSIIVVPPFWQRWWFRTIILLVFAGMLALILRAAGERRRGLEAMNATLAASAERDRASQQYLERNVLEILAAMQRFSDGDLSVSLTAGADDAIGKLRRGVNTAVSNIRGMVQQVRDVLDATVRTSREIHSNTETLAKGAEEQIDQALLVAGAAEQMAQTVNGNARYITTAAEMAQKSGSEAHEGGRVVRNTFDGMDQIVSGVAASARTVEALGRSSAQIAAITRVIDEIASQTNLLALNSAIEAARAGEQGRAFTVVAHEMQELAVQTANATREIARVIQENDREVETAMRTMGMVTSQVETERKLVDQAGVALDAIIANSERMLASIQQVRASSEEQAATTAHISANIETISNVTRSAATGNQTIAASVDGLSQLIEDLQQRVSRFRLEGDGVAAGGPLPTAGHPARL
jgi:methyl-accepting chemotaxis protein/ligand-binding sensor domain-containing protein